MVRGAFFSQCKRETYSHLRLSQSIQVVGPPWAETMPKAIFAFGFPGRG